MILVLRRLKTFYMWRFKIIFFTISYERVMFLDHTVQNPNYWVFPSKTLMTETPPWCQFGSLNAWQHLQHKDGWISTQIKLNVRGSRVVHWTSEKGLWDRSVIHITILPLPWKCQLFSNNHGNRCSHLQGRVLLQWWNMDSHFFLGTEWCIQQLISCSII